jgi:SanA protein
MKGVLKWLTRTALVAVAVPVTGFLFILINYFLITFSATGRLIGNTSGIARGSAVLVLGAGNSEPGKWVNHTFEHRMEAAGKVWSSDSTVLFIVSGMILPPYYDEAADMRDRLLQYGVAPESVITDTTGTRTWKSVSNAASFLKQRELVIISQREHLERALFCASCQGLKAKGLVAEAPSYQHRFWTYREYLARVKATMDCVVFRLKNQ